MATDSIGRLRQRTDWVVNVMGIGNDARSRYDVVVVGGGQAGLATGYHLARRGIDFVILDAADRVGDAWRSRWDTLRLFTPGRYDDLPGMPFPGPRKAYPTKDEVADYLASYAVRFRLPIRSGTRVERVSQRSGAGAGIDHGLVVSANGQEIEAGSVVVASGGYDEPRKPDFADQLGGSILQLHSSQYRRPSQLRDGPVLVVGAGNSGAEIALDVVAGHRTTLVGPDAGQVPIDVTSRLAIAMDPLIWFVANHILTIDNPFGRKARARMRGRAVPVERARPKVLSAAGVERVFSRAVGVRDGLPMLDDGRIVDATNVIWCTGFRHAYAWLDLPILGDDGWPKEDDGVVASVPGLYFVGLPFQRAMASSLLGGVGHDAAAIVNDVARRATATARRPDQVDRDRETVSGLERV